LKKFGGKTIRYEIGDEELRKWARTHHGKKISDENSNFFAELHDYYQGENSCTPKIKPKLDFDPELQWKILYHTLRGEVYVILVRLQLCSAMQFLI
jgi:hypothetical protein